MNCPNCGARLPKHTNTCEFCGTIVDNIAEKKPIFSSNDEEHKDEPLSNSPGSVGIGFILGFFLGVIGLIIGLVINQPLTKKGAVIGFIVGLVISFVLPIIIMIAVGATSVSVSYSNY